MRRISKLNGNLIMRNGGCGWRGWLKNLVLTISAMAKQLAEG